MAQGGLAGAGVALRPGLIPACATASPCPSHPRPLRSCVPGSVRCVPAPCLLPWPSPLPPVPFNSNNGQGSAAAAHCLPIPPLLPAAGRGPGTGEHQAGHRLTLCPWHSPRRGRDPSHSPCFGGLPRAPCVLPLGRAVGAAGWDCQVAPVPALPQLCLRPACAGQCPAFLQP